MPTALLYRLDTAAVEPEESRPDPAKVLAGDPVHTTWNIEERDGLYCGIWQSTPGKWRISYDEWEYCRILAGRSVITDDAGNSYPLGPGDSFILRPGFSGTWEVIETTRKDYVIRL
ncbi:MAG: cupin domain-containing protein [Rhodobacteraceae bacterium]|nr:cupin domain-containing protein [Paracoccaceae bacterium]